MGAISSTIRINDGMSTAMRSMNKALNIVLSSFEKLQRVSANAIDTADIADARAELSRAAIAASQLEDEINKAGQAQDNYTNSVNKSGNAMNGLLRKAGALLAGYSAFQVVNLSDRMTQTESRMGLILEVDENGKAVQTVEELQEKIMASANRSRASYLDTAEAVTSFAQRAGDAFSGNDEVIAFTENLNKMYAIAGATAAEQSSSMLQLTQALGSGVLRGEEFNAVFEAAPNIMQVVADYMGKPLGQLRNMAAEGEITAEIVKKAVLGATSDINKDFEKMDMTWEQVMNRAKNIALKSFKPVLDKINELANNEDVQNMVYGIANAVSAIGSIVLWVIETVAKLTSEIREHSDIVLPLVIGLAAGYAVYTALVYGTETAVKALKTAQEKLNIAFLGCPIWLIVVAVVALIALLIWAWDHFEGFRKFVADWWRECADIAGKIQNDFIVPLVNGAIDAHKKIMELCKGISTGITNAFYNGAIAVVESMDIIFDQINRLIDAYNAMAKMIGAKTVDISISGESIAEKLEKSRDEKIASMKSYFDYSIAGMQASKAKEWDLEAVGGAFDDMANKIENFTFKGLLDDAFSGIDIGDYLPEYEDYLKGITDSMGEIEGALEITDEDLKYLRDIAEQEAINRFTTAEIKVDFTSNNNVSSDMDLDGITNYFEEKLLETMQTAAEGVY